MAVDVYLRVSGVDLTDEATTELLAADFPEVAWSEVDDVLEMGLFIESDTVVHDVVETVRKISNRLPGLRVHGVHRDLVATSDIAARVGVSREAVRKWSMEKDFPPPFDTVGGGTRGATKVWAWADVVRWLYESRGIDMEENLPDVATIAQIEACLLRVPDSTTVEWHTLGTASKELRSGRPLAEKRTERHVTTVFVAHADISWAAQEITVTTTSGAGLSRGAHVGA